MGNSRVCSIIVGSDDGLLTGFFFDLSIALSVAGLPTALFGRGVGSSQELFFPHKPSVLSLPLVGHYFPTVITNLPRPLSADLLLQISPYLLGPGFLQVSHSISLAEPPDLHFFLLLRLAGKNYVERVIGVGRRVEFLGKVPVRVLLLK